MKSAVNRLSTQTAAASSTLSEGPCTPIRRPQTPCLDLPDGKGITMEDPSKDSCHLRPSSVALCQDFSLKWALSAHRWGRSNAAKQCKNGCGMTQESATQWNHAPQTCYPHPLERTQRLGPRGMAITGSCYNVLVKSSKKKGRETKGYRGKRRTATSQPHTRDTHREPGAGSGVRDIGCGRGRGSGLWV